MSVKRICLVSPGHVASNPRLVKEADALHEAGYAVTVVAGDITAGVRPLDDTLLARAQWRVIKVGLGIRPSYISRRLRQELARKAFGGGLRNVKTAVWAHSTITKRLANSALAERADLYIGHYLAALPAVAMAASRNGAKLGFDAEDDHVGELEDIPESQLEIGIRQRIEAHFLPLCQHLTAASPGIARSYYERYGVRMTPVLNVFPLVQAPCAAAERPTNTDALCIYWFSQTIGPGRGLEPFIKAMGKMRARVTLSVRGSDFLGYSAQLKQLAADAGVGDAICFLPSAPPDEMVRLAARHDLGLASELGTPRSRAISLTNKIFTYLLAGLPVILSDTPAQRELAAELGEAGCVVDLSNPGSIATALDVWASDAKALAKAKSEARRLAQTRFNWDREKERFLQSVNKALGQC